ncbi:MAG: proton-conducting membrane transporter [Myxococcales bacterium]|nr:proton-conducting membrane transporter [Myxococcales bacterium]
MTALLLAIPVLLAGVVLATALPGRTVKFAAAVGSQAVAAALVLWTVVPVLAGRPAVLDHTYAWSYPFEDIRVHVDALAAFFLVWSLPLTLLGTIYARGYLARAVDEGRDPGPHFALLNLVALSFVVVYTVQNALVFLLGWETAAVSAWLLVIWDYRSQKIRFAGFNYLVSTHIGLFVLVAAFMLMHSRTQSMDFASFATVLAQPGELRDGVFVLLAVAFALKAAFFPMHTWLPRAHAAAPAHVSALMSGVIHKAGLFGLLRFLLYLGRPDEWMGWAILVFGLLSALFGVLSTAAQRDLKRLLGYSSTENVGIAAVGFGLGCLGLTWQQPALVVAGFGGGVFHLFNHALFKCLLFYAAGAIYRATHSVDLERLGGLARAMPWTAALFLIGGLAIAGLPPLNGFWSEFLVIGGLAGGGAPSALGNVALAVAAALLGFVGATSALAVTRAFGMAFLGTPRDPKVHTADPPASMRGVMVAHAVGVIAVGLVPTLGLALVQPVVAQFTAGVADAPTTASRLTDVQHGVWIAVAIAAATVGAGVALARRVRRHVTWGCGYTVATPRLQYTATSFSALFNRLFEVVLPSRQRGSLPKDVFPTKHGNLEIDHADPVEGRMFEVLAQNEEMAVKVSQRVPDRPRLSLGLGLAVLVALVVLALGGRA